MKYRKYIFKGKPELLSILSVFLFEDGFEGVEDKGIEMHGFIKIGAKNDLLSPQVKEFLHLNKIDSQSEIAHDSNWNAIWESSFEPIIVGNKCIVRANHHEKRDDLEFDIVINPKMTFGTGHHPTTYLMIKKMLPLAFENTSVFDFGTGTGVLAILAELMGAAQIFANDIDENCIDNTKENFELNKTTKPEFRIGDIELVENRNFDFVLANVTRNTILERWTKLEKALKPCGTLIISGFYNTDYSYFEEACLQSNLQIIDKEEKDNWLVIVLKK
ncbi:MAG: 50S ribosomal protein L11 methyltransferase [Bacteroidia bacterium]